MKRYYIFYNKDNKKYEVRKANIIGETEETYVILEGEERINKKKSGVFDDKEYANIVKNMW